jgi:hypothetical protein
MFPFRHLRRIFLPEFHHLIQVVDQVAFAKRDSRVRVLGFGGRRSKQLLSD